MALSDVDLVMLEFNDKLTGRNKRMIIFFRTYSVKGALDQMKAYNCFF